MIENKWKGKLNRYPKPPLTHRHTLYFLWLNSSDEMLNAHCQALTLHRTMCWWRYEVIMDFTQFTCWKKNYHYYCYYIIIIAINICINSRQFFFIGSFENLMHDENILLRLHKFNKLSSKIIMKIERFLCVLMMVRWKVAWESMYSHLIDRIARFIQRDSFCTAIAT